jgi:hypothetical protein
MAALMFDGSRPSSRRSRRRQAPRFKPQAQLESLEDRRLLSGTWAALANPMPAHTPDGTETMLLLSDGTVMVQGGGGGTTAANAASSNWFKLTPDAYGNYANGTWSTMASMGTQRLFEASNVLKDGRVFVLGGEYSGPNTTKNWINTGEIYDPVANTWTATANFPQAQFGDDPTAMLPDGRVLAGYLSGAQTYSLFHNADSYVERV